MFRREYQPLNLDKIQWWVDTGRLDTSQTITLSHLRHAGLVSKISKKKAGVKLLAHGKEWFNVPSFHIEVNAASVEAIKTVENLGGSVTRIYMDSLGLRMLLRTKPWKGEIPPPFPHRFAAAPQRIARQFDLIRYDPYAPTQKVLMERKLKQEATSNTTDDPTSNTTDDPTSNTTSETSTA